MGLNVMEPEDIVTYTNERWKDLENLTTICMLLGKVHGQGLFLLSNPLSTTLPLLLAQLTLASLSILFTSLLLKPLHQSIFVAQTLGSPSLLGRSNKFTINVFPPRGFILLDLLSAIGYTFYFFLVGSRTFLLLSMNIDLEPRVARFLPIQAQAQCVSASPTMAILLTKLKIINSEFGRPVAARQKSALNVDYCRNRLRNLLIFIICPGVLWIHASSLHLYYRPILLGLTILVGPLIGSALAEKLEFITYWMFMPYFFVNNGLVVDVFNIKINNYIIFQTVALVPAVGKFIGAFASSLYNKIPTVDALELGLLMTTQGLLELGLFKMMKENKVADAESFAIMCISMLIITGSVTPIKKSSMILQGDNAPPAINLPEALNPTVDSRVDVCVLHLIELLGRAKPILIPHKLSDKLSSSSVGPSEGVFTAFRQYEQSNLNLVSVSPYTRISPCATMHDDVCMLALEKRTSLVIIPLHKSFDANDTRDLSEKAARMIMNKNVFKKVPCSVAILLDRGLLRTSWTTMEAGLHTELALSFWVATTTGKH
ncbi:hypothetical protein TIFTF001_026572 [Ficus carica]|uniref:Cation/H+ exchanger domain-containing protein n=1 Tax=Ficus carica TaxID=3494 RepID=A0AA88DLE3_FICCA|nr:hypothetical protein TIFTF001_026572 [Ficus carica]